ncbi:protease inhibitor I42 family protein [Pseudomonas sp. EL_65y_Pfl2_R95]|uniref:protease inhibitor I42 family protein n=1 Tax=Pseudomonas sp. EL_65y_Pfl2_R95 TaxID=3088698 RepID=UPI0030D8EF09
MTAVYRLLPPLGLALLAGCATQSNTVNVQQQGDCPLALTPGQQLIISLPSNPTTGFRWVVRDAAPAVLTSLGPEVYSNPEDAGLVGSAGKSTWRYTVKQPGEGQLLMTYQRPWETEVEPAERFECVIKVK